MRIPADPSGRVERDQEKRNAGEDNTREPILAAAAAEIVGDGEGNKERKHPKGGGDGDLEERGPGGDRAFERWQRRMGDEHEQSADDRQRHDRHDAGTDRSGDRAVGQRRHPVGDAAQ